ncbi:MAG: ATP-dependent Clp protease ATP-binding subunit [Anaerolineaceae bacterium]|nr:ATP-dependent Clp protease ATP-binding subunit [Anaerolineaceae bacterium]HQJ32961.1 ATP-dependent Clp protease ATP-binding subunit [Anaerolineaceae bacterium]
MYQLTQKAKKILSNARRIAMQFNADTIGTDHLLAGIIAENSCVAYRVLRDLGIEENVIFGAIQQGESELPDDRDLRLGEDIKKTLEYAIEEAEKDQSPMVGTEHILLGLSRDTEFKGMDILIRFGITPEQLRRHTNRVLRDAKEAGEQRQERSEGREERRDRTETEGVGSQRRLRSKEKDSDSNSPLVDQLATDLTALAEAGKLDPVIGRQKEIERVIQILARRTKNNPALIGEPGVGKTAIVEGLAQRIIEGDVPALLLKKRVLQLDVGSLVAGTMYRGQFEERLKRVIDELKASGAIVFIDEFHMLVGAGSAGSSVDAANILKPALSRGELQMIGATTINEYRKNIESDAALERRFQPIMVEEPTIQETIAILHGIRPKYEEHHRLKITDEALESAAKLSARYVTDRFLPDKAIDLVDEAASRVRMYKSEAAITSKDIVSELRDINKQLNDPDSNLDNDATEALTQTQLKLEDELQALQTGWDRANAPTVTEEDIAEVISMWTGIPLTQIAIEESTKLLHLEEELGKVIIGQTEAIQAVSKAIRRARAGLKSEHRPIGSFMFLGPTGVGKTELTKALAKQMFGSEDALIQIDMSEFMERHSMSRLVGAPPGYIGYEESGQLTEAIRRKPYSIVVFDEIEKAHPEALNMLLQIMEEGHLTDAKGHKVDFRNAIIIMTTNIGAELIRHQSALGFALDLDEVREEQFAYDEMHKKLIEALKRSFRPEFVNRLDSVIVFRALNRADIREIVSLEIQKVQERLVEQSISLFPTDSALDYLAELGYDPEMGARPVRRVIQQQVEERLSDGLLAGDFGTGDRILIDLEEFISEDGEPQKRIVLKRENHTEEKEETPEMMGA